MKKVLPLLLVALIAMAGGVAYLYSMRTEPRAAAPAPVADQAAPTLPAPAAAPTSAAPAPAGAKSNAPQASVAAPDVEADLARITDSGTGNVALAHAHAIEECATIRSRPDFVNEMVDMHQHADAQNVETVRRYSEQTIARCKAFNGSEHSDPKALEEFYLQAEKEGSRAAKARNLARDVMMSGVAAEPITAADLQPVAIDLLSSGDPDTLLALSDLMGETSKLKGTAAGTSVADAAWKLVACDFGLDCSNGSRLLRGFCLNGGMYCGPGDLRANMMNGGFPPETFAQVQELEHTIYQAIRDGKVASLFDQPQ